MNEFGFYVIPSIVFIIIVFGFIKKVNLFDTFLCGASEGFKSAISLVPSLVGLIVAVNMLKSSGIFDIFSNLTSPIFGFLGIPCEVVPMAFLRPISGGGSIALLDSLLKTHGPDSFIGRLSSIMMGSTETTFYTLTVYFSCIKIKDTKYAFLCSIIADIFSMVASVIILKLFLYA